MTFPIVLPELEFGAERRYWLRHLAGTQSRGLTPPIDRSRAGAPAAGSGVVVTQLDSSSTARLLGVAGPELPRLFCLLIAAVKLCLFRYSGASDIRVGTTVPRDGSETASALARLNRVLVLRTAVDAEMRMVDLIECVRQTLADAYRYRRYPAGRLRVHSDATGDEPSLFRLAVLCAGLNDVNDLTGFATDVQVRFELKPTGLQIAVNYSQAIFDERTMVTFAAHLRGVASELPHAAHLRVGDIALEPATQPAPNRGSTGRTAGLVHRLFDRAASQFPDRPAVRAGDAMVTYRWLERRSNQLARRLRRHGAGPGARLGIYLEPSLETVVAILGILKTGAAYVPLEPGHPEERVRHCIADAGVTRVLSLGHHAARLRAQVPVLCIDLINGELCDELAAPVTEWASPLDIAYVIFTSGSTGRQKGVAINHLALANYLAFANERYFRREASCFALGTSLAFDLGVTSILVPLISGGSVDVLPLGSGEYPWDALLAARRVDCLKLTPSHLQQLRGRSLASSGATTVVVGGERFDPDLACAVAADFGPGTAIINEYGPTEATVGCIVHTVEPCDYRRASLPIGYPVAGCRADVLSPRRGPVAPLELGELFLSGPGVAMGYIGDPQLTAERFLPDPFGTGERIYRTGDLARRTTTGALLFEGRKDGQVKYHGHRLELGEVQAALLRHPDIRDARVRLFHVGAESVLVGYYVSRLAIPSAALRTVLAETLLPQTIPSLFCHLLRLPLTLNGKVDLNALPNPDELRRALPSSLTQPETPTQAVLATLWCELLGTPNVGRDSNFFELGGHSLLASQMIHRVEEVLQVRIEMRSLFEHPVLGRLAMVIDNARGGGQ
jgi:amino acid adenylation domain-containing protein